MADIANAVGSSALAGRLVLIETIGGNTIYNANDPVLTLLGTTIGKRPIYTLPKAGSLHPNQQVSFDKEHINLSLEQIAEKLSTKPEYAAAQADVFLTSSDGRLVPCFKDNLIRGIWQLANNGKKEAQELPFLVGMSEAELKKRILGEGENGFSARENGVMARVVHGYVSIYTSEGLRKEDGSPIVTESAVREWVTGEVYAPRERDVFYALFDVNPVFEKWLQSLPGQDSPWNSYKLWVIVRQGVRHYFETIKAKGAGPVVKAEEGSQLREGGKHVSLSPFIQHILDGIYHDRSVQHADLLITGVSPFKPENLEEKIAEMQNQGKPQPHLYMGLCKEKPEDLQDAAVIPYSSIPNLLNVISEALLFAVLRYTNKPGVTETMAEIGKRFMGEKEFAEYMSVWLPASIARALTYSGEEPERLRLRHIPKNMLNAFHAAARFVKTEAINDQIDSYINQPRGTVAAAIEMAANCRAALPHEYFEALDVGGRTIYLNREARASVGLEGTRNAEARNRKRQLSVIESERRELVGRLESEYGMFMKSLLSHVLFDNIEAEYVERLASQGRTAYQLLWDSKEMVRLKQYALEHGAKPENFITREEARRLLETVGLPHLLRLIPNLTFFDQVITPQPSLVFL